jgi:hypothetical protein
MKNYNDDERLNYWHKNKLDTDQFEELKKHYREEDRKKLKFELFKIFLRNNHEIELKKESCYHVNYRVDKVMEDSIKESKQAYDKFFEDIDG